MGSIVGISDSGGKVVEKRHYGAWGALEKYESNDSSLTEDHPLLDRGWTGHEYFAVVHLVHMNGRMYGTDLRRFLSPDNYVQDPSNTQNYNRYQYGYNNPLKYSDPNGEFLNFVFGILGFGAVSYFTGVHLSGGQYNPLKWNIGTFAKVGALALLNVATAGIGSTIYAGVLSATGLAGFIGGFTAGAISGAFVGLMSGAGYALAAGQNIVKGALNGAIGGAISGGLLGGVSGGLRAMKYGGKFWNGDGMTVDVVNYYEIKDPKDIKVNNPIEATDENLAKYVKDKFPNADLKAIRTLSTEHVPGNLNLDGIRRLGVTKATFLYRAAGHEWSFSGFSEVYIHSNAFNNADALFNTVAHEMVHVSQNLALVGTVYNEALNHVYEILKEANAYDFTCNSLGVDCKAFDMLYRPPGAGPGAGNKLFELYSRKYFNLARLLNWRRYSWTRYFRH